MKQHPIPQDITNYKFHLIGSMTLKQFAELAVAAVLAFITYKTNLVDLIKWPLIFLIVGLGAAIAFVPIEERPLDHWISTFFKNIYRPTKFFWKKTAKTPDFFSYKVNNPQQDFYAPNVNLNPARKSRINEYIKSIPSEKEVDSYDAAENQKVDQILNQFSEVKVDQEEIRIEETKKQEKPKLQTRVRDLKAPKAIEELRKNELPNQISGKIIDTNQHGVGDAIIEVKNKQGDSVRIVKSDADGNFLINRALENGIYQVLVEKDDQEFAEQEIQLDGQTPEPLVFQA